MVDGLFDESLGDIKRLIEETLRDEVRSVRSGLGQQFAEVLREELRHLLKGGTAELRNAPLPPLGPLPPLAADGSPPRSGSIQPSGLMMPPLPPPKSASLAPSWAPMSRHSVQELEEAAGRSGSMPAGFCAALAEDVSSTRDRHSPSKDTPGTEETDQVSAVHDGSAFNGVLPGELTCTSSPVSGLGEAWTEVPHDDGTVPERRHSLSSASSALTFEPDLRALGAGDRFQQIVTSSYFDIFVCTAIVTNSVIITVQSEFAMQSVRRTATLETPLFFQVAELLFCIFFSVELALRIACYRRVFFTMADWKWNVFDFVIVAMQLFDVFLEVCLGDTDSNVNRIGSFNFMRVLRILRLVRIVRLVRVLRYFQDLRTMVSSIASCSRPLLWTVVLLALMINIVGVYVTNLIADEATSHPEILARTDIRLHYGSLFATTLSLYQAMSGGVDWNELVVPLVEEISPLMALVFSFYIMFSVLCMMNVITGIFVESALCTARADKDADLRRQIEVLFLHTDEDQSGKINLREFTSALDNPKVIQCLEAIDIDPSEAKGLFALLDTEGSGDIDSQEFITGCLRLRGQARAIDLATLMYYNKRVSAWWVQRMAEVEESLGLIEEAVEGLLMNGSSKSSVAARRRSSGGVYRSSSAAPAINFGATWADLKAEGDRRVTQLLERRTRRRGAASVAQDIGALAGDSKSEPLSKRSIRSNRGSLSLLEMLRSQEQGGTQ